MRVVLQRVSKASLSIEGKEYSNISNGFVILLGIEENDEIIDIEWLVKKIRGMRVFADDAGKMNLSIDQVNGSCMVVSQFTLHASTRKGNRPSFIRSAKPDKSVPLYELFIKKLNDAVDNPVETGVFGADMQINLINDGPVTIVLDSKKKE